MNLGIHFVGASEGGLELIIDTKDGEIVRRADSIADGVYWVERYGFGPSVYFTSSMDFATEEGFASDDGAKKMWQCICNNVVGLEEV